MGTYIQTIPSKHWHWTFAGLLYRTGVAILWVLAGILVFLLAAPALLLFVGTAVPTFLAIGLVLIDLAFVYLLLRLDRAPIIVAGVLGGITCVSLIAIALSQSFAATPPITDTRGKPVPNSIATLEKVNLNGSEQWITIRGKNKNNPVLLYLGMGGPGGGGFATRSLYEPLEEHFVIVSWDEPGTGKSYNAVPIKSLNRERFVRDAHALTLLLRERFHQDKIYVYGISWTSILGIWLVQEYPDLYAAFISNGQMVNTVENDVMGYELALKYSQERGDTATVETLRQNGPPPYTGEGMLGKYVAFLDVLNDYMGSLRYVIAVPLVPFFAPEYGLVDKVNHTRGLAESFEQVYPQLRDLDFTTQANKLELPVYFFVGRNDVNAMASLVERYYATLEAPHKELIWFENGGHGQNPESMRQFVQVMVNKVLKETQPGW